MKSINSIEKMSWKSKLLALYIITVACIIIVNAGAMLLFVRVYFVRQMSASAEQNIAQTQTILDRIVLDNKKALDVISRDNRIVNLISSENDFVGQDDSRFLYGYNEYNHMVNILNEIQTAYDISDISIYMRSGYVYNIESRKPYSWDEVMSSKWMKKINAEGVTSIFLDNSYFDDELEEDDSLKHIQIIKSKSDYDKIIGVVRISVKSDFVQSLLENNKLSENSILYLENSQGEAITPIDKKLSTRKYKTLRVNVPYSDLSLVSLISMGDMMKVYYNVVIITVLISLLLLLIAIMFSRAIINIMTKKLTVLIQHMGKIKDKNFEPIPIDKVYDDVDVSIESYNKLLHDFVKIIEEQKRNEENTKRLELKILREQINPHFLYNTMEIINSLAIVNNQAEISDVVKSLSEYYKLSLNHGLDLISVREEIRQIELYVKLQNMRFDKNINLIWDVPDDILDTNILKMIMQPIVENAISHGFKNRISEQDNVISIAGYGEGEYIVFVINDNGNGIPEEEINTLVMKSSNGFGLKNANERIKMFYGEECGISIESKFGVYTSVEIRITEKN